MRECRSEHALGRVSQGAGEVIGHRAIGGKPVSIVAKAFGIVALLFNWKVGDAAVFLASEAIRLAAGGGSQCDHLCAP